MSPHTSSYDNLFRFYNDSPVFARKHYVPWTCIQSGLIKPAYRHSICRVTPLPESRSRSSSIEELSAPAPETGTIEPEPTNRPVPVFLHPQPSDRPELQLNQIKTELPVDRIKEEVKVEQDVYPDSGDDEVVVINDSDDEDQYLSMVGRGRS